MKFKVGDRVKAHQLSIWGGEYGTVVFITEYIGVEFDKYDKGRHSCGGKCPMGHGWWYTQGNADKMLELVEQSKPTLLATREYTVGSTVKVENSGIQGLVVDKGDKESIILSDDKLHIVENSKCFIEMREVQNIVQHEKKPKKIQSR